MIYFPNSKINIGLFVTEKRNDGFHNIDSIFYPISLGDCLEINRSKNSDKKIHFHTDGIQIPSDGKSNLVVRAYELLDKKYNLDPIECFLLKNVPTGAGIGGGSADAAYMIKGLNDFFRIGMSTPEMEKLSLEIGSDCPFFIQNKPAIVSSRGEVMEETKLDLTGKKIVLVKADIHISTKDAYSNLTPKPASFDLKKLHETPISRWKDVVKNDFEEYAFKKYPVLQKIKDELYELGAEFASMSGSGSSIYGIFDEEVDVQDFWEGCFVWTGVF